MKSVFQAAVVSSAALAALLCAVVLPATAESVPTPTFNSADFDSSSAQITNHYWPLTPGTLYFYSESGDGCEVEEFDITNSTRDDFAPPYNGIAAREIHDRSWVDETCTGNYALIETTSDWYAQDKSGNVWYFGETTTAYDDPDECPTTAGTWLAGTDGAEAGIVMFADPKAGVAYRQEFLSDVAEDMAKVLRLNATVSIGLGTFAGCLETKEWSPLERGAVENKFYCPVDTGSPGGIMLIKELKGKTLRTEFIGNTRPDGDYADAGVCP